MLYKCRISTRMEKLTWIPYAPTVGNIDIDVEAERRRVSGVSLFFSIPQFFALLSDVGNKPYK